MTRWKLLEMGSFVIYWQQNVKNTSNKLKKKCVGPMRGKA